MSHLNIRMKLLVVFMLLFTGVFLVAFVGVYRLATESAMESLRRELMITATTAANLINVDALTQVFETGVDGDTQYDQIAEKLRTIRDSNPRVTEIYTLVRSPNPNELLFVVDAWEGRETRAALREPYDVSEFPQMLDAFNHPVADEELTDDEWGAWLSGYAPVRDETGASVAIVGVDMPADGVIAIQTQIKRVSILVFVLAYALFFLVIVILSRVITDPLRTITDAAKSLEDGEKFDPESLKSVAQGKDEISLLARVFSQMAVQVQAREQKLKDQVVQLKIEIDEAKRAQQVSEIADSDFFRDLQKKAKKMRKE